MALIATSSAREALAREHHLQGGLRLAAVFLTGFWSATLLLLKPLIVGALIDDYHFSPTQAGFVAGIEMAGLGLAALLIALAGARWPRRTIVLIGAALGIAGSLVPIVSHSY